MHLPRHATLWVALLAVALSAGQARPAEPAKGEPILELFVKEFVEIRPGSFTLGSSGEGAPAVEKPAVEITLSKPFRLARYEVTQELYNRVMGNNPARWKGPRNSVEMVDWDQANTFCVKATNLLREKKLIKPDEEVRLPSEAEWEYACRAGTKTAYSFGDDVKELGAYAWYKANSPGEDPPVGRKKQNPWGLYDMHGYVSEWCADSWSPSHEGVPKDGSARSAGGAKERAIKGGSFADPADECRCASRRGVKATERSDKIGFRCVLVKVAGKKEKGAE